MKAKCKYKKPCNWEVKKENCNGCKYLEEKEKPMNKIIKVVEKIVAISAIFIMVLLFGCQKSEIHTVTYQIKSSNVKVMEYRYIEDSSWIEYSIQIDSTSLVDDHPNYTDVFYIYYHVTFEKDLMGSVSVKLLWDGKVMDEYIMKSDRCLDRTAFITFKK